MWGMSLIRRKKSLGGGKFSSRSASHLGRETNGRTRLAMERLEDRTLPSLTFPTILTLSTGRSPGSVAIGDVNNDGIPDLVINNALDNSVGVYLGIGGGKFGSEANYSVGPDSVPSQIALGDFGNGHLDIAVADAGRFQGGDRVSILLGNGDGTFQSPVLYTVGTGPGRVVAADLTGNHILDLVVSNEFSNSVSVLMGNGNGTFQPAVNYSVGVNPLDIGVADFNKDGIPDIAVANFRDRKSTRLNSSHRL